MTAPAGSISRLTRPAAHFDTPAVSDRSVWAEPSRAWCVDAYRRSRNGGVAELSGEAQQQSGRCRRRNRQLLPNHAQRPIPCGTVAHLTTNHM